MNERENKRLTCSAKLEMECSTCTQSSKFLNNFDHYLELYFRINKCMVLRFEKTTHIIKEERASKLKSVLYNTVLLWILNDSLCLIEYHLPSSLITT